MQSDLSIYKGDTLLSLPCEILLDILFLLSKEDVQNLSLSCKRIRRYSLAGLFCRLTIATQCNDALAWYSSHMAENPDIQACVKYLRVDFSVTEVEPRINGHSRAFDIEQAVTRGAYALRGLSDYC